jgi:hypothetical protein
MKRLSRTTLRRLVIQESYGLSLTRQLYEQAAPAPADPTATTPPADATAPADPTAPAADPAVPAPQAPATPAAVTASPAPAAPAPTIDPAAVTAGAITSPAAITAAPIAGVTPTPAPTAAAAGETAKKKSKAPDPEKEPMKSQVNKALMKATSAAAKGDGEVATESIRRRSMRFLLEQEEEEGPKIDMGVFAGEIAKLIKNFTSLVDVKKNVIAQAEEYLDNDFAKNAEDLKKQLKDLLRKDYHISLERPEPPSDSYAVGAKSGGGAAA